MKSKLSLKNIRKNEQVWNFKIKSQNNENKTSHFSRRRRFNKNIK